MALRSTMGLVALAGVSLLAPEQAWASCTVGAVTVQCGTTSTTDTSFPANAPNDRAYQGPAATPIILNVDAGETVSGNGLAVTNTGTGGVTVTNNGTISVDPGNAPTADGTAALSVAAAGGPIVYTGGNIVNNGTGNGFDATQTGGVGSIDITLTGDVTAATGEGVVVRNVATSTDVSVVTNNVTALAGGRDGIDVQTQSLTGDVTIVANGDIAAGNAGIVGAIFPAGGTGNIDVTANGRIDARFGIDAENFGTGSTSVTTVGPVNATTGNGIFAQTSGGDATVLAGDVTSTGNTAIVAQQTSAAGSGAISVVAGNVSGTTGIIANNSGTGDVGILGNGTITGTFAEGIKATGNDGVTVVANDIVTGATRGLSLIGGTGGAGDILVTGTGGFVGGTGDAANILNNGNGTATVDISGASSSAAGEGIFVRDTAAGGDISVTTGAVTALAGGKDAIDVQTQSATADVTIVANGDIAAGNAGIVGAIFPAGGTGNIDVTANGAIDARFGIDAENFGTGSTSVATVGPVTATTGNAIFALSTGGDVTVIAGDVGSDSNTAVIARQTSAAGAGVIDVTVGTTSGTTGVEATNSGTGATNVTATGAVTGTFAEGVKATGNDAVTVKVADTVTGATTGLLLTGGTGGAGDISVTGTGGFAGGTGNAATIQNNGSGNVLVDISGASASTDGEGITVRDTAAGGNVSVTTGAVTALAGGKDAIDVQTQSTTADIKIVANGDIAAGNAGIVGAIFPAGGTGNIDVTANGAIDARFGIDAENFGRGNTSVTTVGPVTATTGNGIFALSTGGDVTVITGDVSAVSNTAIVAQQTNAAGSGAIIVGTGGNVSGTTGIVANNSGTGTAGVIVFGSVTGTAAEGIKATGNNAVNVSIADTVTGATRGLSLIGGTGGTGNISVTGIAGFVGGTGDAANILNNGSGTVTVNISGASSSTAGEGILVRDTAAGGDISVTTGAVAALAGGKDAIDVQTQSLTADMTIIANGDLQAGNAGIVAAIFPAGSTGNIAVTANGAIDARFGIDAENFGTGSTSVTTVGPVTATTGNGIFAQTSGGNIAVTAGNVTSATMTAVVAQNILVAANSGTIDVTLTAGRTLIANTPAAFGIYTDSGQSTGTTTINVNGKINAGAAGVRSLSTVGNIITNVAATGAIDPLVGIDQTTVSGALTVNNAGLVEGDDVGVRLTSTGAGAAGALTVNQMGTGTIRGAIGVDLASVDAALAVTNAGLITGTTGIRLTPTGTGNGTITNSGTITGSGNAVLATLNNGSFTLTNTGILNGAVNVTGSNVATSTMTNAAGGTANFGAGASSFSGSFVNAGTANIGAGGTVLFLGNTNNMNRINFAGAGSFTTNGSMTNGGIINAQNGLTGNIVTVGGNYVGGGQFFADYNTGTMTADRLNIAGSASGTTNVTLNRVGGTNLIAGGFLPVVTVAGAAADNSFTSNTIFGGGLLVESFGRNPANATQFGLLQGINPSAATLGSLSFVAEAASMLIDEPISPYVTARSDPAAGDKRFGLWMRGASGHTKQAIAAALTGGGFTINPAGDVRTEHQAIQMGADLGLLNMGGNGWNVHVGITGGWYDGAASPSVTERLAVDTSFVGGYVAISNGALTIDAQIRREWRDYDLVLPTVFGATKQEVDGKATAGSVHASYRFGGQSGFAATPFLGFNYADSRIDDLTIDANSVYSPGSDKTKVGRAGLRLSYRAGSVDQIQIEPFASAAWMKNWSRDDAGNFTFGAPATNFSLATTTWDDAQRYSVGLMGHARGGRVSAFIVGNIDDGSGFSAFTVNGGIRFNF